MNITTDDMLKKYHWDNLTSTASLKAMLIEFGNAVIKADRENIADYNSIRISKNYVINTPNIELL